MVQHHGGLLNWLLPAGLGATCHSLAAAALLYIQQLVSATMVVRITLTTLLLQLPFCTTNSCSTLTSPQENTSVWVGVGCSGLGGQLQLENVKEVHKDQLIGQKKRSEA